MVYRRVVGAQELTKWDCQPFLPADELRKVLLLLQRGTSVSAMSIQLTKGITNSTMGTMLNMVMEAESTASPFCTQTAEFQEIMAKFTKK
jgi:2-(1,2-epoxy-1,2-dihydrophenyl)acetyl-CoA isomerase